jgi:hypothetical protein
MATVSYNRVISEIKELSMTDQLRLLEEMAGLIRRRTTGDHSRSILELRGKGKQIWQGIDVQKYIDEERSSWNG